MSLFNSQNQKHYSSSKHSKKRLTQDQVRLLETSFNHNKKLEPERKLHLACQLGIPPRQIAIWYQNKRARWKAQSLELDFSAVQLRLETTLAEKRRLEREVERLRGDLDNVREMLLGLNQTGPQPPPVSSLSRCDDERESSSLHDDVSCSWINGDESSTLEEIYSCFIGANVSHSG